MASRASLLANLGQRLPRRQRLGVDAQLDHAPAGPQPSAASNAAAKSSVRSTASPCAPNARGERREVRVDEVGAGDAARIVPLLVHPDRPVHAVVDDEHDDRRVVLHRGRELLAGHQEVAVAGDRNDVSLGVEELGRHGRGHAVAHRAARRRELRRVAPELVEAVRPDREVAGAVREDRVGRQPRADGRHHLAHVEVAGHRAAAEVVEVVGRAPDASPPPRARRSSGGSAGERARERVGRGGIAERGRVDAAELLGVGVTWTSACAGIGHAEQRVAGRRDLAQPVADHEQDVGVAHPLREPGVGAERRGDRRTRRSRCRRSPDGASPTRPGARALAPGRQRCCASALHGAPPTTTSGRSAPARIARVRSTSAAPGGAG